VSVLLVVPSGLLTSSRPVVPFMLIVRPPPIVALYR
jgi:hypothetical protein